ncbi:MAG TPA: hypothetical protein PKV84_03810 [Candidatus Omnitrophota bacterium]|nr:hypothetical protein [Candidatus Omnitrophota bacterium]
MRSKSRSPRERAPLAAGFRFCDNNGVKNYLWKYFLPGAVLVGCAFWAGTLPSPVFALAGFLSFFVIGVTLIVEGRKKSRQQTTDHKR